MLPTGFIVIKIEALKRVRGAALRGGWGDGHARLTGRWISAANTTSRATEGLAAGRGSISRGMQGGGGAGLGSVRSNALAACVVLNLVSILG